MIVFICTFEQVEEQIKNQLEAMIIGYRDDPDMQNLIDWVQKDWVCTKCLFHYFDA